MGSISCWLSKLLVKTAPGLRAGKRAIAVCLVDVLGNDASATVEVKSTAFPRKMKYNLICYWRGVYTWLAIIIGWVDACYPTKSNLWGGWVSLFQGNWAIFDPVLFRSTQPTRQWRSHYCIGKDFIIPIPRFNGSAERSTKAHAARLSSPNALRWKFFG
jgi:hypothetical protein